MRVCMCVYVCVCVCVCVCDVSVCVCVALEPFFLGGCAIYFCNMLTRIVRYVSTTSTDTHA